MDVSGLASTSMEMEVGRSCAKHNAIPVVD